MDTEG